MSLSRRKRKRKPRRISDGYLERVLLYYLERYGASRSRARRFLIKRVNNSLAEHNPPDSDDFDPDARDKALELVETVLDRVEERGLINDEKYALAVVKRLRKKGKSTRAICAWLRQRGVPSEAIDSALLQARTLHETFLGEEHGETRSPEEIELESAMTFVRKRRLGPFSTRERDHDTFRKELGKLARAGFSYRIARAALEAEA